MNYETPKEFVTLLDRTFIKFISLPILFFFVYYVYSIYNQNKGVLFEPDLKQEWIYSYVTFWALPIFYLFKKKKKMIQSIMTKEAMKDKLDVLLNDSIKNYWLILIMFIFSIIVFYFTNHPLVSFPVWVMIIIVSIEKPSIYRVGKTLRFRTKDQYMTFINDIWP